MTVDCCRHHHSPRSPGRPGWPFGGGLDRPPSSSNIVQMGSFSATVRGRDQRRGVPPPPPRFAFGKRVRFGRTNCSHKFPSYARGVSRQPVNRSAADLSAPRPLRGLHADAAATHSYCAAPGFWPVKLTHSRLLVLIILSFCSAINISLSIYHHYYHHSILIADLQPTIRRSLKACASGLRGNARVAS